MSIALRKLLSSTSRRSIPCSGLPTDAPCMFAVLSRSCLRLLLSPWARSCFTSCGTLYGIRVFVVFVSSFFLRAVCAHFPDVGWFALLIATCAHALMVLPGPMVLVLHSGAFRFLPSLECDDTVSMLNNGAYTVCHRLHAG